MDYPIKLFNEKNVELSSETRKKVFELLDTCAESKKSFDGVLISIGKSVLNKFIEKSNGVVKYCYYSATDMTSIMKKVSNLNAESMIFIVEATPDYSLDKLMVDGFSCDAAISIRFVENLNNEIGVTVLYY